MNIAVINDQHPVKVCPGFDQAGLDRIAQTVLGGLVNHVERFQAFHIGQQLSIGTGCGKLFGILFFIPLTAVVLELVKEDACRRLRTKETLQ